jgi:hypothetical protein
MPSMRPIVAELVPSRHVCCTTTMLWGAVKAPECEGRHGIAERRTWAKSSRPSHEDFSNDVDQQRRRQSVHQNGEPKSLDIATLQPARSEPYSRKRRFRNASQQTRRGGGHVIFAPYENQPLSFLWSQKRRRRQCQSALGWIQKRCPMRGFAVATLCRPRSPYSFAGCCLLRTFHFVSRPPIIPIPSSSPTVLIHRARARPSGVNPGEQHQRILLK